MGGDGSDTMAIYGTDAVLNIEELFSHHVWSDDLCYKSHFKAIFIQVA